MFFNYFFYRFFNSIDNYVVKSSFENYQSQVFDRDTVTS